MSDALTVQGTPKSEGPAGDQKEAVITLRNVSKTFTLREGSGTVRDRVFNVFKKRPRRQIKALTNINLQIYKGEFFGVIGHNGSGKSTLLRIIAGTYPPDPAGEVVTRGRFMRLALGMGFDPELTAHENIFLNASILGLTMKQIRARHDSIIELAQLEDYVHTKTKFFSTGMLSRLKFAIAVQADADIFLMDEFFGGVGDLKFRKTSERVFDESIVAGRTIVHVSHSLSDVLDYCDRVLVLHFGTMAFLGDPAEGVELYRTLMAE